MKLIDLYGIYQCNMSTKKYIILISYTSRANKINGSNSDNLTPIFDGYLNEVKISYFYMYIIEMI